MNGKKRNNYVFSIKNLRIFHKMYQKVNVINYDCAYYYKEYPKYGGSQDRCLKLVQNTKTFDCLCCEYYKKIRHLIPKNIFRDETV